MPQKKRKRLNKIKFKNFFQKTETPQKNGNASKKVETPQLNQVFKNSYFRGIWQILQTFPLGLVDI